MLPFEFIKLVIIFIKQSTWILKVSSLGMVFHLMLLSVISLSAMSALSVSDQNAELYCQKPMDLKTQSWQSHYKTILKEHLSNSLGENRLHSYSYSPSPSSSIHSITSTLIREEAQFQTLVLRAYHSLIKKTFNSDEDPIEAINQCLLIKPNLEICLKWSQELYVDLSDLIKELSYILNCQKEFPHPELTRDLIQHYEQIRIAFTHSFFKQSNSENYSIQQKRLDFKREVADLANSKLKKWKTQLNSAPEQADLKKEFRTQILDKTENFRPFNIDFDKVGTDWVHKICTTQSKSKICLWLEVWNQLSSLNRNLEINKGSGFPLLGKLTSNNKEIIFETTLFILSLNELQKANEELFSFFMDPSTDFFLLQQGINVKAWLIQYILEVSHLGAFEALSYLRNVMDNLNLAQTFRSEWTEEIALTQGLYMSLLKSSLNLAQIPLWLKTSAQFAQGQNEVWKYVSAMRAQNLLPEVGFFVGHTTGRWKKYFKWTSLSLNLPSGLTVRSIADKKTFLNNLIENLHNEHFDFESIRSIAKGNECLMPILDAENLKRKPTSFKISAQIYELCERSRKAGVSIGISDSSILGSNEQIVFDLGILPADILEASSILPEFGSLQIYLSVLALESKMGSVLNETQQIDTESDHIKIAQRISLIKELTLGLNEFWNHSEFSQASSENQLPEIKIQYFKSHYQENKEPELQRWSHRIIKREGKWKNE